MKKVFIWCYGTWDGNEIALAKAETKEEALGKIKPNVEESKT